MADVETLLGDIERLGDEKARELARAVVGAVLDMHRAGLAPLIEAVRRRGGAEAVVEVARDAAVGPVLLLHGLHPVEPRVRAREALEAVAATLRTLDATARLDETTDGSLRVHIEEGRAGKGGAVAVVEAALSEAVPDVPFVVESARATEGAALLPVSRLTARRPTGTFAEEKETCDLCAAAVGPDHDHLLDPGTRDLRCACGACASLFASSSGRWRRVPRRVERLRDLRLDDDVWEALGLPIELAFFYRSTHAARVVAMYPGPAGATESTLSLDAWSRVEADNPVLRDLSPDVEALLVRRTRAGREHYRVSIDTCFALAGRIRKHWKGLGGGQEAWDQIGGFFSDLERTTGGSRPCTT